MALLGSKLLSEIPLIYHAVICRDKLILKSCKFFENSKKIEKLIT